MALSRLNLSRLRRIDSAVMSRSVTPQRFSRRQFLSVSSAAAAALSGGQETPRGAEIPLWRSAHPAGESS